MKILVVAMSESIHTARWLSQISDRGWEIHLFPSIDIGFARSDFQNITIHHSFYGRPAKNADKSQKLVGFCVYFTTVANIIRYCVRKIYPDYRAWQLKKLIQEIKPDIIHSIETQQAGYLVNTVKKNWSGDFPKWLLTVWGSDLYLFSRFPEHKSKILEVLSNCDYYSGECNRDICLAKSLGFKGKAFPAFPVNGGFELEKVKKLRQAGPTSKRKVIMLKGYQGWAGRALCGLEALGRCADLLKGYTVKVYSIADPNSPVPEAIKEIVGKTGLNVEIVPLKTPHNELLRLHGQARISIGLSISDGISTSLLEAIVMGSFPIQTSTACADEWIENNRSGIIVPPDDVDAVENALRKALRDDELVDSASALNAETAKRRLDYKFLKEKSIKLYEDICENASA